MACEDYYPTPKGHCAFCGEPKDKHVGQAPIPFSVVALERRLDRGVGTCECGRGNTARIHLPGCPRYGR